MNEKNGNSWDDLVSEAIELAERHPEQYRAAIVSAFLTNRGPSRAVALRTSIQGQLPGQSLTVEDDESELARELGTSAAALRRIVDIGPEGTLRILARIDAGSLAERANDYAAVYCFLKEKLQGEIDTHIEELRQLCQTHGCYDSGNFTGNFRRAGLVLEIGQRGTSDKRYRLSNRGEQLAREILRDLLSSE